MKRILKVAGCGLVVLLAAVSTSAHAQISVSPDGITLYVQNQTPGKDNEANWLPAPTGPFFMAMRLYWPQAEALEGRWTAPPLQRTR